ncbi:MAG: DUF1573 domain-containing protein [Ferruginibacter sp.]|nr:DUF1573 domain-containing protein [Cytophagales bacterium]
MKQKIAFTTGALWLGLWFSLAAVAQVDSAASPAAVSVAAGPQLTFAEKSHDFGDIQQGDKVSYTFKFTNTGSQPLVISEVKTTCGCTATSWTKEPVAPGATGEVAATFNSAGKRSTQRKVIAIYSNAVKPLETVVLVTNVRLWRE